MRLYGIFNVFQRKPALVIPIFVDDDGNKYSQVIIEDLIVGFKSDDTDMGLITLVNRGIEAEIGDEAIYAYQIDKRITLIGTRKNLIQELKRYENSIKRKSLLSYHALIKFMGYSWKKESEVLSNIIKYVDSDLLKDWARDEIKRNENDRSLPIRVFRAPSYRTTSPVEAFMKANRKKSAYEVAKRLSYKRNPYTVSCKKAQN